MQTRALGASGLEVSPLCLGGNVFGWTADEKASFAVLDAFAARGFNFIDTADIYSVWVEGHQGGESETVIGNWLRRGANRQKMIIATKVGGQMAPDRKGLKKAHILDAAEESLRRLQTDYIDLYQSHFDDPETPFEETLEAFEDLIRQGKVRAIGASNLTASRLEEALNVSAHVGLPRYESLQPHYNLVERARFEEALEAVCLARGLAVIPYFSLASGFLTGKYRSPADTTGRARGKSAGKYLNERGFRILAALDEVAKRRNATPAQVSLAWLMVRPSITAPIASATSVAQVMELMGAAELRLEAEDIALLDVGSA
jgi:aryl-alcohol dehydrogenase-like predicted oxidoreductase